jgi:hypothetical protein
MTTMTPAFRAALIGQTEKALNAIRRVGGHARCRM